MIYMVYSPDNDETIESARAIVADSPEKAVEFYTHADDLETRTLAMSCGSESWEVCVEGHGTYEVQGYVDIFYSVNRKGM